MDTPETWITPLTPLSFLRRSAAVYPEKVAIVHGTARHTYADFARDAQRLARGLRASGVGPGDRVACLLPNVPEMLVAHFGVPLGGAVLVAVNTRLSSEEVRYILDHSGATVLVVDSTLRAVVDPVADSLETVREIVTLVDPQGPDAGTSVEGATWDDLLARGDDGADLPWEVDDERSTISINYTSGTTGRPKGVQYHHRGAYLNSLGEIVHSYHDPSSVYLWTLPMFHCNGWCTPWGITAIGGTHVCLREVRGDAIWALIDEHRVTHLNGAPTVVTTIMNAAEARTLDYALVVTTAGAPPSPTTILEMEKMGFRIVHVYGLTETYGPYTVCQWQEDWRGLEEHERARLQARQGVGMLIAEPVRVVETLDEDVADDASAWASVQLVDVPADGRTMGEIVMRGNNVMSGYFRDDDATAKAFAGGWYHSGDLGVMHPDGYVELRDRAKDVVISGGENISTVEVEQAVLSHPAVLEAAVVGVPDERWGERPKAFVVLRQGKDAEPDAIIDHVKGAIARYKAPRDVEIVEELPKTSTGKIQKFALRAKEWGDSGTRIRG
ncbi:acyl--CoA ligase family protein [Actinomycetospora callitridis]|uniref:acyl--CoA ligase family protein n=1 Tax=Actinomycetospora callitridis TaxID=913944 RepID=UPI0023650616|nr:acyl--CoA ligase family protein [Actinomycetospora callitridis]MDD7916616.1 acyl--CoA ligase family protein [Actinomycetospora callitridis]